MMYLISVTEKPRPEEYERIYWDFFAARDVAPRRDGNTESLKSLMEKAGFDEAELAKLAQAEANSNGLVRTEEIAMHAIVGQYEDAMGISQLPVRLICKWLLNCCITGIIIWKKNGLCVHSMTSLYCWIAVPQGSRRLSRAQ
ncbi:hypothetical protein [Aliamphritea spongicola]|nr:hypothetical protein [Aliamphritea spongicola]